MTTDKDTMSPIELPQEANLDNLEAQLSSELEEELQDLAGLEEDYQKIGSPDSLGNAIMDVVWEQFINQIGVVAGEDFIRENRGLTLDLRNSAHIQTTENFANGNIATHNTKIDYQKRHDDWLANFRKDENGNVITHTTRSGKEEATLTNGARTPFDKGRPTGSAQRNTDMDHTNSAGEIIRDPAANAHLSKDEQIGFANSEANLNEMDASQNRSKGDKSMTDWLDNPNSKGQKPNEIFDISEEQERKYREKDKEAREEYEKVKKEGEKRSKETGKQSQKEEAFRIGGAALNAAMMGLLAELTKNILQKLVAWFRSKERTFSNLVDKLKEAIHTFVGNLKQNLLTAGNTAITTILTAIWGPIIGVLKKVWIGLKQGYKSLKEAVYYVRAPENKHKPLSILMMEVGKIILAGVTAGGAVLLGDVIEKNLTPIPIFAFPIPLLGSLASILGIFFGAVISGIIGAIGMNLIDRAIAAKMRSINKTKQLDKANEIRQAQSKMDIVVATKVEKAKEEATSSIVKRHAEAKESFSNIAKSMKESIDSADKAHEETNQDLDNIFNTLNSL